jgi:hypothetical protein
MKETKVSGLNNLEMSHIKGGEGEGEENDAHLKLK